MPESGRSAAGEMIATDGDGSIHATHHTTGVGTDARREPLAATRVETTAEPCREEATFAHPLVLVDPRPASLVAVWSLRRRGTPLHLLASSRFEPAIWARGARRHHLPDLDAQPLAWSGRLLELVAYLEPRPLLVPCSRRSRDLIRDNQALLRPHYTLTHVEPLDLHGYEAEDFRTEKALRRTVLRGEPAFEVQVVLDAAGRCTGSCVLAWVADVPPRVLVTSVEGADMLASSLEWLRARGVRGFARLIWAPDRFGRVDLQAAGTIPGSSWVLAADDGVDFPALWYASLAGIDMPVQQAQCQLSRTFPMSKSGLHDDPLPLVPLRVPWSIRDPLPFIAGIAKSLLRR